MKHLPLEIYSAIIEQLGKESAPLCSCALVCSSFRKFSQRQLFRVIRLNLLGRCSPAKKKILALHTSLVLSPQLASFVRKMHIELANEDMDDATAHSASAILYAVTSVERVTIFSCSMPQNGWYHLSKPATTALLHVLRLPSCRKLVLDNVEFPCAHLRSLTHLRHLEVASHLAISQDPAPNNVALALPTQLQFLETLTIEYGDEAQIAHILDVFEDASSSLSIRRLHGVEE
ncbi:hypothetical protein H0H81_005438 [Sphagnurus paluster]|uniref:F-box domain-containing protein n=1 Tax=Sphagnurus paluster TaxID=117069 RepID=A0A9P7GIK9_9AGAR|nr:hypothetical protein H0H81_005438 [Sphagnurus paluster]